MRNSMAAILKFINGRNDDRAYLAGMIDYVTDPAKTDGGSLVTTQGCSKEHPLADILRNKQLYRKTRGKQGEHFVLSFNPDANDISYLGILDTVREIVSTVYPQHMAVIAVHTDTRCPHAHVILDSVNAITGRKFSQGPAALNRVKQKCNSILMSHGFEIITASANDFIDHTDYTRIQGFDFLELNESELITASDLAQISAETAAISLDDDDMNYQPGYYPTPANSNYGGFQTMNRYFDDAYFANEFEDEQTQGCESGPEAPVIVPTQTPTACMSGFPENGLPNTAVVTGPTFHLSGSAASVFSGLNNLVEDTYAYAQEHQREAANLALAMQQNAQQHGYSSNIAVISGPIFDIDLTSPLPFDPED